MQLGASEESLASCGEQRDSSCDRCAIAIAIAALVVESMPSIASVAIETDITMRGTTASTPRGSGVEYAVANELIRSSRIVIVVVVGSIGRSLGASRRQGDRRQGRLAARVEVISTC